MYFKENAHFFKVAPLNKILKLSNRKKDYEISPKKENFESEIKPIFENLQDEIY